MILSKIALAAKLQLFIFIAFVATLLADDDNEKILARRIHSHLTLHDYPEAVREAESSLQRFPHSSLLIEMSIQALACEGKERKMLDVWETYLKQYPEKAENREVIEEMAWGVLKKASHSSSLVMRQMSLLAAFFSQDAKGVHILSSALRDPNYAIRAMAVKLAGHLHDHQLVEGVKALFQTEKVWGVRQKVIEAVGQMKIKSLQPNLEALIASDESHPTEKVLAMTALLELIDAINRPEIERLSSSNRSGLRQLACKAIAHYQSERDLDCLYQLSKDPHPDVRRESIQAIGLLRPSKDENTVVEIARRSAQDTNYQVSASAAWLLTIYRPEEGKKVFARLLYDERREVRVVAAAALSTTGMQGVNSAVEHFRSHNDPYVKLNLALGLIGLRQASDEASRYVSHMLLTDREKWNTVKVGIFKAIASGPTNDNEDPLSTPESDNQLLRLELLNLLAILKAPEAQQAIRNYLSERCWEISATAAVLLLTEGDESAIDIVKQLLEDPQPRVRLQAALILSLWSREESAIKVLEEGYLTSDWELKARILEGIGRIGSMRSVPFLIQVLKEPSQTLRLIGAMAIIQCLNH